ncbi:hypothetical protein ACFQPE_04245 [Halomarina halobia]|uniref:Uncharacterized protein n=1 Tax=Halomarina halobia TaxID=3033386 RepID=A0ABD6A6L1_9EURY
MPLDSMDEMLDDNIWDARTGEMVPPPRSQVRRRRVRRASLENNIIARITSVDSELPIGPLELQVAYKLYLEHRRRVERAGRDRSP